MRFTWMVLLLPLALGGCFSFSSTDPTPPQRNTTVVVPPGSQAICADGTAPPCQ
ncbi:MAG: hypothetical protein KGI51_01740 [Rhodospirillales bacterium]|nr:hypothetical protein [Rhodospirillales bacterium]